MSTSCLLALNPAFHNSVNANAEALRSKFVSHEGKETIIVRVDALSRYHVSYDWMAKEMTKEMKKKVNSQLSDFVIRH